MYIGAKDEITYDGIWQLLISWLQDFSAFFVEGTVRCMGSSWSCCKCPCGAVSRTVTVPILQQRSIVFLGHVLRHVSSSSSAFPFAGTDSFPGGGHVRVPDLLSGAPSSDVIPGAINRFPESPVCPWSSGTVHWVYTVIHSSRETGSSQDFLIQTSANI